MLNGIWIAMVLGALVCGALTGSLDAVAKASVDSAKGAVELAIGLIGVMAFWLGMMQVLQRGGLLKTLARALRPVMTRLFPDVPKDHPAMSLMIMNVASNMLGLGNAATPFGIKAIMELDNLNPKKGTATDSMALFLAINTSGLALLPTGMIAVRASLGSAAPGSIVITTMLATILSTITAVLASKFYSRWKMFSFEKDVVDFKTEGKKPNNEIDVSKVEEDLDKSVAASVTQKGKIIAWSLLLVFLGALVFAFLKKAASFTEAGDFVGYGGAVKVVVSEWPLILLIGGIMLFGLFKGVKIYDAVVEGGKEGFNVALRIIPFLVAILVAVGMLRASGAIDLMVAVLKPFTAFIGMPAETLPMALIRTLSGSGAFAVAAETIKTYGADSMIGNIVSTMQGSTETTFYVLAVYFGAVGVRNARHAVLACLTADVVGILAAVWTCRLLLG